jgi:hypothetical protein
MGVLISFLQSVVGIAGNSEERYHTPNTSQSATSDGSLCAVCLDRCPVCFNFLAQVPHEGCGLWFRSQSTQAKIEGWGRYFRLEFKPIQLPDKASSTACSSCALIQECLRPYEGLWKRDCSSALLIMSKSLVIQLLKGQNAILILELIIKESKSIHGVAPQARDFRHRS